MTATTIEALQAASDTPSFVRKIGIGVGFMFPMSVDLPEKLTGADGVLQALPAGALSVGIVNTDGYTFGSETDKEDVEAFSYVDPVRSDINKITRTVEFSPYEIHKRHLQELLEGMDLSTVTQDKDSGEIAFDVPSMPVFSEYRFLVVGADGPADNQWILGIGFYRVRLSAKDAEQWQKEGAISPKVTLDVFPDDEKGSPERKYIGGTAALKYATELGYTQSV